MKVLLNKASSLPPKNRLKTDTYSTIYVGGDTGAFSEYGTFIGLSEQVDVGNQDLTDNAFVFANNIFTDGLNAEQVGESLASYVAHEAGHLIGFEHAHTVLVGDASDVLAEVAWKPYSHIEMAKDVRADLLDNGKLTIAGNEYDVNPVIIEAIAKYPSYYYGGAVGPDGFPDLVMGQGIIHPESTGVWLDHILDKAWEAQTSSDYTAEEKLQILAWSYGYLTHAAGDTWAHTLVNEFSNGPFPEVQTALTDGDSRANALRHLISEEYMNDAAPGFDGNYSDRTLVANGEVSSNATPGTELNVNSQFLYDALIKDLPNLPGQSEILQATLTTDANTDLLAMVVSLNTPTAVSQELHDALKAEGVFHRNGCQHHRSK